MTLNQNQKEAIVELLGQRLRSLIELKELYPERSKQMEKELQGHIKLIEFLGFELNQSKTAIGL